jgi:hypothetical protein
MSGVRAVIDDLLSSSQVLSTRSVAARAGVSRQAAQKQLKALVAKGELTVEGKARAARYLPARRGPDLWAKVKELGLALDGIDNPRQLTIHAQARMARAHRVEVASAGSLYRLSARLLLQDVDCDELTLDFNSVAELGDEFVEEVFHRWAEVHPLTILKIVNLDASLAARLPERHRAVTPAH